MTTKTNVKNAERGTYAEERGLEPASDVPAIDTALDQGLTIAGPDGQLTTYQRVRDLAETPGFFKLEEIEGLNLVILGASKHAGQYGPYLLVEFDFANWPENPAPERKLADVPLLTSVGGTVAVPKLLSAMQKIASGRASGPLVACFEQKATASGRMFWDVY